ncbi:hypothetical protein SHJJP8905_000106 [Staphylococcus lugdunensis]|uniref:hypothetical protein n=1 Tax=Staphylococcus lugdunensis TaxID=28035 RepID=UPI001F4C63A7|nr:hypothetical protein [Staphylococcus lugdunensis]MCH8668213.1 hypothetical protein [Staphylococcus lugdunensis]
MTQTTRDELVKFMRKHGIEKVDSITDKKSAIRHFRATSKAYKEERDEYKKQRDELIEDIKKLRERNEELKKKARTFDEIKSEYLKKDYQTGEEIFESMGYIIDELECEGIVVLRAAYKP